MKWGTDINGDHWSLGRRKSVGLAKLQEARCFRVEASSNTALVLKLKRSALAFWYNELISYTDLISLRKFTSRSNFAQRYPVSHAPPPCLYCVHFLRFIMLIWGFRCALQQLLCMWCDSPSSFVNCKSGLRNLAIAVQALSTFQLILSTDVIPVQQNTGTVLTLKTNKSPA